MEFYEKDFEAVSFLWKVKYIYITPTTFPSLAALSLLLPWIDPCPCTPLLSMSPHTLDLIIDEPVITNSIVSTSRF